MLMVVNVDTYYTYVLQSSYVVLSLFYAYGVFTVYYLMIALHTLQCMERDIVSCLMYNGLSMSL